MKIPRDYRQLVAHAISAGWTLTRTRGGHLRLTSPAGALVHLSNTPSCHRAGRNLRADLRRGGLDT